MVYEGKHRNDAWCFVYEFSMKKRLGCKALEKKNN